MKKIGLVGGISPTSTKLYYDNIISIYRALEKENPEIIIYSVNLQKYLFLLNNNKYQELAHEFLKVISSIKMAGADLGVITAVSMHAVMPLIREKSEIPLIDGVSCLVNEVKKDGKKNILLLGTDHVMVNNEFTKMFKSGNIMVTVPNSNLRTEIERIIKTELNQGIFKIKSKKTILSIIKNYLKKVDGICLCCTALPAVISQKDISSKTKVYDFISSHIKEIVKKSLL